MKLTFEQAAADIVKVSAAGSDPDTQKRVADMCIVIEEFINGFAERTDGYMLFAAFMVSFSTMKKIIEAAPAQDQILLRELVLAVIGSFGRTVQ